MCQYLQDALQILGLILPLMKESVKVTHSKEGVQLLWASCREVYNVIQADEIGADIITCPADVVKRLITI